MKYVKNLLVLFLGFVLCFSVSCKHNNDKVYEKFELSYAKIDGVEFKNSETIELKQNEKQIVVSGIIDEMTQAEKEVFYDKDATHIFVLKIKFNKDKKLSKFVLNGSDKKVYSNNDKEDGYVGSIDELLDSKENEDEFVNLILSANISKYVFDVVYEDGESIQFELLVKAAIATTKDV